jgi:hypothetical protein
MRTLGRLTIVVVAFAGLGGAARQSLPPVATTGRATRFIAYSEAKPTLERLAPELAAAYAATAEPGREPAWRDWLVRRDDEIRARLRQGDEDSLVNLLLFGTSFTGLPRVVNDRATAEGTQRAAEVVRRRLEDLIAGLDSPGTNERLQFAREIVERRGIDPATASGREQARDYLLALVKRTTGDAETYARAIESVRAAGGPELAVRSTLFRTRGLSSDTSLRPDFAIDQTLAALRARGLLDTGSVRRVAVIGPGLDFTDKAEGYDFYPQQSTQPFALIDSLLRRRLATAGALELTTIDLSPRVNRHLQDAQRRAAGGAGYVIVLPRERGGGWTPDLVAFWKSAGASIGESAAPPRAPDGVEVRALRLRPAVLRLLQVRDLNIVVERIDPLPDEERFDLVVATNVLVYYDVLEQSLALANIAAMLRPGGFLLSNNVLVELPSTPMRSIGHTDAIYGSQPDDRDQVVWYRRE